MFLALPAVSCLRDELASIFFWVSWGMDNSLANIWAHPEQMSSSCIVQWKLSFSVWRKKKKKKLPKRYGKKNILELCREQMQLEAGEVLSVEFLCNVIILAVKFSLRKVKAYSLRSIFISRGTLGIAAEGFTCRGWSSTVQSQSWRCQIFWQQATVPWRLLLGESVRYPLVKKKKL